MKYLTYDDTYYVCDIETDGLQPTVIWVCCIENLVTGEQKEFYSKEEFNVWFNDSPRTFVGHNFLSYDAPALNRLWGSSINLESCVDTLTLSLLYNPALDGGHSLEAWGQRLKYPKGNHNDWSRLTPEMVSYCKNDVSLTAKLYKALSSRMLKMGYSNLSCEIEHKIRIIINQQEKNGFYFDKASAQSLLQQLRDTQCDLSRDIQKLFPPVSKLVKSGTYKRNKDGSLPAFLEKARDRYDRVVITGDTYEYYDLEEFNIGSPKQRVERLLGLGWEPQKFTEKGFPKVDEDALMAYSESSGRKEIGAIAEWLVLQGRSSMLEGWLNNLGPDSRIHGRVNSCGAATRRMLHSQPNSSNIPSAHKAKYGKECRELWGVEPGKGLIEVGVDASGLENVCLLHYLGNKEAEKLLAQPKPNDVHTLNAKRLTELLGREIDREWGSKTSYYATLYGAYPPKLASIIKGTEAEGKIVQDTILNSVPGLANLVKKVQYEWKSNNGRIRTIDSGYVLCPSSSAALNYLIQACGAIVMKLACIILHEEAEKQNLWFRLVGTIHDEWQMETKEEDGERLGRLAVWSIEEAARRLNFNVPLTGEFRLGYNWAMCH